jgi:hypothetical protein
MFNVSSIVYATDIWFMRVETITVTFSFPSGGSERAKPGRPTSLDDRLPLLNRELATPRSSSRSSFPPPPLDKQLLWAFSLVTTTPNASCLPLPLSSSNHALPSSPAFPTTNTSLSALSPSPHHPPASTSPLVVPLVHVGLFRSHPTFPPSSVDRCGLHPVERDPQALQPVQGPTFSPMDLPSSVCRPLYPLTHVIGVSGLDPPFLSFLAPVLSPLLFSSTFCVLGSRPSSTVHLYLPTSLSRWIQPSWRKSRHLLHSLAGADSELTALASWPETSCR